MPTSKNRAIRVWIIAALCLCIPLLLWAYPSDPPLANTGAPTEAHCNGCHTSTLVGSGSVKIAFSAGGSTYIPGTAQTLTITVNDTTEAAWGFEMTALEGSVQTTPGTFAAASSNVNVLASGSKIYARHFADTSSTFSVIWTPPASSVYNGPVAFYVASVAGAGGSNYSSDHLYQNSYTLALAPNLTVTPGTLTFNYQLGGATPPAQNVSVGSTGSALSYTATSSTNSGGSWLSATPAISTTPGSESVSVNPTGLTAGTYTGSVSIASGGALNTPQAVAVTLNVTPKPNLTVTPSTLTFNYQIGGATPAAQSVSVGSTGSALSYTATSSTNSGGNWLSATPASSTTPGSESVSVNTTALAAGTYTGSVSIASSGAGNSPQIVSVTLNVTSPNLTVTPSPLTFNYQIGGTMPVAQSISVGSTGSALSYTATSSTNSGGSWLSATPASSTTPGSESVSVNTTGLATGTYTGSVSIASSGAGNSPQTVAVTLNVTSAPNLTTMPSTLTFNYQIGGATPAAQSVSVGSTGSALSYTITSSTSSGGNWLSATPASSTTPGSESVSVNVTGLAAGTYTGSVAIASTGASNSPQTVPVTLNVTAARRRTRGYVYITSLADAIRRSALARFGVEVGAAASAAFSANFTFTLRGTIPLRWHS